MPGTAIRFPFRLRPLADVHPWGSDKPNLHWFGLTQGSYHVEVGGFELLRYAEDTVLRLRGAGADPYVDYYVVRLWEDLLALLPSVLEPVPEDLLGFVAGEMPEGAPWEEPAVEAAGSWHAERWLYLGYLLNPPGVRFWRTVHGGEDTVTVDWSQQPDGEIGFAGPAAGRVRVPTADFLAAVVALDRSLLAAMEERTAALESAGAPAGVDLDVPALRAEQQRRAEWLPRARARRPTTDWTAVREGAARLRPPPGGPPRPHVGTA